MKACEWTVLVWLVTAVSQVFGNTGKSVNLVRLTRLMFCFRAWWLRYDQRFLNLLSVVSFGV